MCCCVRALEYCCHSESPFGRLPRTNQTMSFRTNIVISRSLRREILKQDLSGLAAVRDDIVSCRIMLTSNKRYTS